MSKKTEWEKEVEREHKVLKWTERQVKDLSKDIIRDYWEKSQPRKYVEIMKELNQEEDAAFKWARGVMIAGYESGNFEIGDEINLDTFTKFLKSLEPKIFREMEKNAKWFSNELKKNAPELYDYVALNGGNPNKAEYIGNEGKLVWYEIETNNGFMQVLYDPSARIILDAQLIP